MTNCALRTIQSVILTFVVLTGFTSSAYAIGDSGGCTRPSKLIDIAAFGTPKELIDFIDVTVNYQWDALSPQSRRSLEAKVTAKEEWRTKAKRALVNGAVYCSGVEWLLDHAAMNGNISVVQWLLDAGADPSGTNSGSHGQTIFERCAGYLRQSTRSDGLSLDEVVRRRNLAFKLLVSRGGDVNRVTADSGNGYNYPPKNSLTHCSDESMLSLLLELGADRSPQKKGELWRYAPLQDAAWRAVGDENKLGKVAILARGGFNDLRGTRIEQTLAEACAQMKNQPSCLKLATIVQVSPGVIPGAKHKSSIGHVQGKEFSLYREACSFPELKFYDDFEPIAVTTRSDWKIDNKRIGPREIIVSIDFAKKPVVLFLTGLYATRWNIHKANHTRIVGAVVTTTHQADLRKDQKNELVGLDASIPVYFGKSCGVFVSENYLDIPKLIGWHGYDPTSLDPFRRKKIERFFILESGSVDIGEKIPPDPVKPQVSAPPPTPKPRIVPASPPVPRPTAIPHR